MSIELQLLDCNCNNCKHMVRDFNRFQQSMKFHEKMQFDYFNTVKSNLIKRAKEWQKRGDTDKHDNLVKEANRMRFQFDKSTVSIQYGNCTKLNKPVSFIPNTCQLETQNCFEHRKQNQPEGV